MNLNEEQKRAAEELDGPLLILAGPGTGKTTVLVQRTANILARYYLAHQESYSHQEAEKLILLTTFTRKAAGELKERLARYLKDTPFPEDTSYHYNDLLHINVNEMYIGTFDSLCIEFLEKYDILTQNQFRIIEEPEKCLFVYSNLKAICNVYKDLSTKHYMTKNDCNTIGKVLQLADRGSIPSRWTIAEKLLAHFNLIDRDMFAPYMKDFNDHSDKGRYKLYHFVADAYDRYKYLMEENCLYDYTMIERRFYDEINPATTSTNLLQQIQADTALQYIEVDEYQDTNYLQEEIIRILGGKHHNICVVGDDDQGIYRFRGATLRNILGFRTLYPTVRTNQVILHSNYRSAREITAAYSSWMDDHDGHTWYEGERVFKALTSERAQPGNHPAVYRLTASNQIDQEYRLWRLITDLKESGRVSDLNQVCFIAHSLKDKNILHLMHFLDTHDIPVNAPDAKQFFEQPDLMDFFRYLLELCPEVKDGLAGSNDGTITHDETNIKLSAEAKDYYQRCLHRPLTAGLTRTDDGMPDGISSLLNEDSTMLDIFYTSLSYDPFGESITSGYEDAIDRQRRCGDYGILTQILMSYDQHYNLYKNYTFAKTSTGYEKRVYYFLTQFITRWIPSPPKEYEGDEETPPGYVTCLTIHQSKGLEFPVVIVGSLERRPSQEDSILTEEENRFFYSRFGEPDPFDEHHTASDYMRLYYTAFSRARDLLILTDQDSMDYGHQQYFDSLMDGLPDYPGPSAILPGSISPASQTELPPSYSFTSDFSVYNRCPTRYMLQQKYGFRENPDYRSLRGSLIHQTMEDVNKALIRIRSEAGSGEASRTLTKEFIHTKLSNNISLAKKIYPLWDAWRGKGFEESCMQALENYFFRNEYYDPDRLIQSEMPISMDLDGFTVTGQIDLLRSASGEDPASRNVDIIDYKTNSLIRTNGDFLELRWADKRDYAMQLSLYQYILEHEYGYKVRRRFLFLTEDPDYPWQSIIYEDDIIDRFKAAARRISDNIFPAPAYEERKCARCSYRYYCKGRE